MAKIQGFLISAKSTDWDTEKNIVTLSGNVQIVYNSQHIQCDQARIDLRAKTLVASGNVQVISDKTTMGGDRISLDYESNNGIITDGYVVSGNVFFNGKTLQKSSENEYFIMDADYSSCANCPPSWSFYGTSMRAELGGYAYIKNAILRIGSVPVFWLPYLIVPLKSDRQSGFLSPKFNQSNGLGTAIELPFFWAISRSSDATITLKNYEHGGVKSLLNFRYLLSENSHGEFNGSFFQDKTFGNDSRFAPYISSNERGQPIGRYLIKYNHYYEMPEGYIQRAEFNWTSDLRYNFDFPSETTGHGDPAMENRVSLTKNTDNIHASLDSSYYINMLQANPLAGNEDAVHRIPEIQISQAHTNIGDSGFLFAWNTNYTNFARAHKSYDKLTDLNIDSFPNQTSTEKHRRVPGYRIPGTVADPLLDKCSTNQWSDDPDCRVDDFGSYVPYHDLIRTGQRLKFNPSISRPFNFGDFFLLPTIGFQETQYKFNTEIENSTERRHINTELRFGTYFSKVFSEDSNFKETRYKHEIKPEISYRKIPWIVQRTHSFYGFTEQSDIPYFSSSTITDEDLSGPTGLQFDYSDRIFDRDLLTFSVTNNLTKKTLTGESPQYLQIASLYLAQSYDIFQASRTSPNKEPWSNILGRMNLLLSPFEAQTEVRYYPYQKVANGSAGIKYKDPNGDYYQLTASRSYNIVQGQPTVDQSSLQSFLTTTAGLNYKYFSLMGSFDFGGVLAPQKPLTLNSWAYAIKFKPPGNCLSLIFGNRFVMGGEPTFGYSFEIYYDGNPNPTIDDSALRFTR